MRAYNASYNYFAGMTDAAVAAYQKDAVIGHRPTWAMGVNAAGKAQESESGAAQPGMGISRSARRPEGREFPARPGRARGACGTEAAAPSGPVRRALDILGLDETVDAAAIKAQYKALVKRFHPDANGGDRSFEERLRDIIKAHDTLKTAGLC